MATAKQAANKVTTPEFRASFLWGFKPQPAMKDAADQTPKYGVTMLFDEKARKTPQYKAMFDLAVRALKEKFGSDKVLPDGNGWFYLKVGEKGKAVLKNPFRDGAEKSELDGYDGMIFAAATSKMQPGMVDASLNRIIDEQEFVSGHYARATVTAYGYDKQGNKGVAFGLQNLQKLRDGEAFSGRTAAENDFDQVDTAFDKVEGDEGSFLD
jgi:hypothetical protein